MAWDRLKLMIALVAVALLALVVLVNRLDAGRAPSDRTGKQWHWTGPKTKAALIVLAFLGLVVLVNRLDMGGEKDHLELREDRLEIRECRDKHGYSIPCPLPPEMTRDGPDGGGTSYGKNVGERTICVDDKGNERRCPWLPADQGSPRPGG